MSKIAVVGPGAIGGMLAAWLCQDKANEVIVCGRRPLSGIELETPKGMIRASPKTLTDPSEASPVDWVLVCVKTYQVKGCETWLGALVGDATRVAVVQNGVEHVENLTPYVRVDRILPVMIGCPSERLSSEKIKQGANGLMVVPEGEMGVGFEALFRSSLFELRQSSDFKTEAWKKLCLNAAGAVMAITDVPSRVSHHVEAAGIMRNLGRECWEVACAEGADLDESVVDWLMEAYQNHDPESINSLHADRRAGRPMEIHARNGIIVELGKKHGIATPYNEMAVGLLKAVADVY